MYLLFLLNVFSRLQKILCSDLKSYFILSKVIDVSYMFRLSKIDELIFFVKTPLLNLLFQVFFFFLPFLHLFFFSIRIFFILGGVPALYRIN